MIWSRRKMLQTFNSFTANDHFVDCFESYPRKMSRLTQVIHEHMPKWWTK